MPELPEVETVRRGLEPLLVGKRVLGLEQRRPDLRFPFPDKFAARVEGQTVASLHRRAKYLRAHIESGDVLVMHLGMSGRFTISHHAAKRGAKVGTYEYETGDDPKHDHVVFHMSGGATITFNDPRRFGFMLLVPEAEIDSHPLFRGLGPEPLGNELNAGYLAGRAAGRTSDLKAFLMDQRTVAGLGNIYVCEALHRAGLSPKRTTGSLGAKGRVAADRAERLVAAIRAVLIDAIAAGGSTLRDYRKADGTLGEFQHTFCVYGREGEPCLRAGCGGTVRRVVQGQRSTFYCPTCQR